LILGDFNLDLLKSDAHYPTNEFVNCFISQSFEPTIIHPTRITEHSATLIDNIFVNSLMYEFATAIVYSDISDNLPVVIYFNLQLPRTLPIFNDCKRSYSTESTQLFIQRLSMVNWLEVCPVTNNGETINDIYSCFFNIFHDIFEEAFPPRKLELALGKVPRMGYQGSNKILSQKIFVIQILPQKSHSS